MEKKYDIEDGYLRREGENVFCPFTHGEPTFCGVWCALFDIGSLNQVVTLRCGSGTTIYKLNSKQELPQQDLFETK